MRNKDGNKQELVKQKAIEIIVKDGLEGFTISKLAKACSISVGTPYVYYKDKDDLIFKLVLEETSKMELAIFKDFDPESLLEDGLRVQWGNRLKYMLENPLIGPFFDQIGSSGYQQIFLDMFKNDSEIFLSEFKRNMINFVRNAVKRGEMQEMSFELYWSVAFSPLYALIRFHNQGYGWMGKPFEITDEIVWEAFDRVIKALK